MSRTNWNFARARQNAWGAAELCSARTIAGRFGNPPRVSITIVGSRRASPFGDFGTYTSNPCPRSLRSRPRARRGPSREGLETLPGFPSQSWGAAELPPFGDFGTYTSNPYPRSLRSRPRARRGPSRAAERSEGAAGRVAGAAGLETLRGFPSQSC